jgi:hypothetical protein
MFHAGKSGPAPPPHPIPVPPVRRVVGRSGERFSTVPTVFLPTAFARRRAIAPGCKAFSRGTGKPA